MSLVSCVNRFRRMPIGRGRRNRTGFRRSGRVCSDGECQRRDDLQRFLRLLLLRCCCCCCCCRHDDVIVSRHGCKLLFRFVFVCFPLHNFVMSWKERDWSSRGKVVLLFVDMVTVHERNKHKSVDIDSLNACFKLCRHTLCQYLAIFVYLKKRK